jgi:hypothetical protein
VEIDLPGPLAEVRAAFARYEDALNANDVQTLNELFWRSPRTLRYGTDEELYGHDAVAAFRSGRTPPGRRQLGRVEITTYGRDFATASCEFRRAPGKLGRQMQTWMRTAEGWRIVAAHVSLREEK